MLVKNWKFAGGKVGLNYSEAEVEKLEGIAGEGVKTPSSFFGNHQVVEVKNEAEKVWEVYDPSYGSGPIKGTRKEEKRSFEGFEESEEVRLEYQVEAIAGFCRPNMGKAVCGEEAFPALEFLKVTGPRPSASPRALRSFRPAAMWETMTAVPKPTWLMN